MKPFIAIMIVVCFGLVGIWLWKSYDHSTEEANNAPSQTNTERNNAYLNIEYEQQPLEKLPEHSPKYFWPLNGKRMASPVFPVLWKTNKSVRSRLLKRSPQGNWVGGDDSFGIQHVAWIDLSKYDSEVTFCVEFESGDTKFRSSPRTVSFGGGARFSARKYRFALGDNDVQTFLLEIEGRGVRHLNWDSFQHARFPESLALGHEKPKAGQLKIVISNASSIEYTTTGYFEVIDSVNNTIDRCMVTFTR